MSTCPSLLSLLSKVFCIMQHTQISKIFFKIHLVKNISYPMNCDLGCNTLRSRIGSNSNLALWCTYRKEKAASLVCLTTNTPCTIQRNLQKSKETNQKKKIIHQVYRVWLKKLISRIKQPKAWEFSDFIFPMLWSSFFAELLRCFKKGLRKISCDSKTQS